MEDMTPSDVAVLVFFALLGVAMIVLAVGINGQGVCVV